MGRIHLGTRTYTNSRRLHSEFTTIQALKQQSVNWHLVIAVNVSILCQFALVGRKVVTSRLIEHERESENPNESVS